MDVTERLSAFEEIANIKAKYCYYADTKDWAGLAMLFADHAVFDIRAALAVDPDNTDDMFSSDGYQIGKGNIIASVVATSPKVIKTVHHCHNPEFTVISDSKISVVWPMEDRIFFVNGDPVNLMHGFGHYHDTYEKIQGKWLITEVRLTRLHIEFT